MTTTLKAKSLCKLKKEMISQHIHELAEITRNSQHICSKCAPQKVKSGYASQPLSEQSTYFAE